MNLLIKFLEQIAKQSEDLSSHEIIKTNDIQDYRSGAVFFLYVKSVKTFRSIVILLQNGRDEDAQILLRTLLENMFVFFWLQQKGDLGFLRFWRFELVSKLRSYQKSLWETIVKRKPEEHDFLKSEAGTVEELKAVNERLMKLDSSFSLQEYESNYDAKGWWAGDSMRNIALELSKSFKSNYHKWQYDIPYDMASNYVHSNPITFWDYVSETNGMLKSNLSEDTDSLFAVAGLAADIMLDLMYNFDERFSLKKKDSIDQLYQHSISVFNQPV